MFAAIAIAEFERAYVYICACFSAAVGSVLFGALVRLGRPLALAMPTHNIKMYRYYCPLGEECGKNNSYVGDAPSLEEARERLEQHFATQPTHVE